MERLGQKAKKAKAPTKLLVSLGPFSSILRLAGLTALHLAAQRGHVGVVRLLLEAACDLHLVTLKQHETALHLAADHGHPEVVALLLEMKAEKDQGFWSSCTS